MINRNNYEKSSTKRNVLSDEEIGKHILYQPSRCKDKEELQGKMVRTPLTFVIGKSCVVRQDR